ncbi:MAG: DNA polymerase I [Chlamydiia bacterium]|nr:DNA polymerase I [Chlamydiia bacterium]
MAATETKKIYVIDAVGYLFRSYFAIRPMTNKEGIATHAVYGFIRSIQKLIKDFSPEYLIAVFDGPNNKKSRTDIYPDYKGHREGMPEDLVLQLKLSLDFCKIFGIPLLQIPGIEADDTMGTIARWAEKNENQAYLCSSDKDLCQLVTDDVFVINTHKDNLLIDKHKVEEIFSVRPDQIIDLLAIMGDSSDNIPGIAGFGPKTAAKLLQEFGTLENIISNVDKLSSKKKQETIKEHTDIARISKKLATIQLDVEIPSDEEFFKLGSPNTDELANFYRDMNFMTLLKDIEQTSFALEEEKEDELKVKKHSYELVDTADKFEDLLKKLSDAETICVDTETTNIHPMKAEIVGIGFCMEVAKAYYIPANGKLSLETIIAKLKPILEDPKKKFFGHNFKYDYHVLRNYDIDVKNIYFDTMLASYLINSQSNRHNLDRLCLEKFGKVKTAYKDLVGTGKNQITLFDVPLDTIKDYCCEDVDYTFRLMLAFDKELEEMSLTKVMQKIEMPLLPVLASMERTGIFVDTNKLKLMSEELHRHIDVLSKSIYERAGEVFNLNSPKQLSAILYDKLQIPSPSKKKQEQRSTSAAILELLKGEYPICEEVLKYRVLEKLRSTYVESLPLQILDKTKKIHCTFNQSVAATGRLSCTDPNLQNIPIRTEMGRTIREAFKPMKEGYSFLAADYSQIELRILAHLSGETALIEAFKSKGDIHSFTASLVFNIEEKDVTKQMRHMAKAVNFGIIYGQQAYGLSQQLGISMKEASEFIKTYFERYPKVKEFIDSCKEKAEKESIATTFTGRRRPLTEIHSKNPMLKAAAERLAVNTPIQGGQADIIKLAMIEIQKKLSTREDLGKMILQIHDELVFEVPDSAIEETKKLVVDIMENIVELVVPLTVDVAIGKNWGEC